MRYLLFLIIPIFISCATVKYDAETGSFVYQRFGNQELIDLNVEKGSGLTKVHLGKQKSEREIAEVLLGLESNIDRAIKLLMELERKIP